MERNSRVKLSEFDISETHGFLQENPLDRLPEPFGPWHEAAENLSDLYIKGLFQDHVKQMPLIDWTLLKDKREKRLAHLQLSFIASGYVWQNGPDNPPKILPKCVAIPLWHISEDLQIQPIISHPGIVLSNWKLKDPSKPFALNNLQLLYHIPGGEDCDSMLLIVITMEKQFASGLKCIAEGAYAVDKQDYGGLTSALEGIRDALLEINETFTNIHRLSRPEYFFKYFMTFMAGWGKEGTPLADGLVYEGACETPVKGIAFTAAQTSIAQSLDAFLDIPHKTGSNERLLETRSYMPKDHRRFIEVLEARPSTREFVLQSGCADLKKAYNDCTGALTDFRNYHIKAVTKYVAVMASKERAASGKTPADPTETDEAKLVVYLKRLRTETKEKSLPEEMDN